MKCSLGISDFLEEISSLSHSVVFLYFFALITEGGFLPLLAILWNSAFKWVYLSFFPLLFASLLFTAICKASSDLVTGFFFNWNIMFPSFMHVVAQIIASFLSMAKSYLIVWIYCIDIWIVSAFWLFWVMLLWTFMYKFLCGHVVISLGCMCKRKILGPVVPLCLTFWRDCWTVFLWLYHFRGSLAMVPIFPHSL